MIFINLLVLLMVIMAFINTTKTIKGSRDELIEHAKYMYGSDRYNITANISSRKWITPTKTAKLIKTMVDNLVFQSTDDGAKKRILDMTGNCGGNILPFLDDMRYGGVVYEIDDDIYHILSANMGHFNRSDDFVAINQSSLVDTGKYDVIIVDPPFGDEYGKGVLYQPKIDDVSMSDLVHRLRGGCSHILLKLPRKGFDMDEFMTSVDDKSTNVDDKSMGVTVYMPDDLRKMDGNIHKILIIVVSFLAKN